MINNSKIKVKKENTIDTKEFIQKMKQEDDSCLVNYQGDTIIKKFENFKLAKKFIEDNDEIKEKHWVNGISSLDITQFLTLLTDDFVNPYTLNDIMLIIENQDVETFQKIHPLWFFQLGSSLTNEQLKFVSTSLTKEQIKFLPKRFIKQFNKESIQNLLVNFYGFNDYHYTVYKLGTGLNDNIFAIVQDGEIINFLKLQWSYINRRNKMRVQNKELFDYNSSQYDTNQLSRYMSVIPSVLAASLLSEDNNFGKYLKRVSPEVDAYTAESLKELLKSCYFPISPEDKDNPQKYFPKGGLFEWRDLMEMYGINKRSCRLMIDNGIKNGNLSYFKFSPKIRRFSKKDFEEFIDKSLETAWDHRGPNRKNIIVPDDADKQKVLNTEYITEEEIFNIIPIKSNKSGTVSTIPSYVPALSITRSLFKNLTRYWDGDDKYYKLDDIAQYISSKYGTIKKDENNNIIFTPVPIKITKDLKFYYKNELLEELEKEYPNINKTQISAKISSQTRNGKIPALFVGPAGTYLKRVYLIEDVKKILD